MTTFTKLPRPSFLLYRPAYADVGEENAEEQQPPHDIPAVQPGGPVSHTVVSGTLVAAGASRLAQSGPWPAAGVSGLLPGPTLAGEQALRPWPRPAPASPSGSCCPAGQCSRLLRRIVIAVMASCSGRTTSLAVPTTVAASGAVVVLTSNRADDWSAAAVRLPRSRGRRQQPWAAKAAQLSTLAKRDARYSSSTTSGAAP